MPKTSCSICIPTYNGSTHLRECLESVIVQTHQAVEILCVDDCSSDDTLELLKSYARQDSRIRVEVNRNNLGLVGNWNRCIELSSGEWIKFVFQDDFIYPQCIEKMLNAAEGGLLIACMRDFVFEGVSDDTRAIYDDITQERSLTRLFNGLDHASPDNLAKVVLDQFPRNIIGEPTAVMFHRDVVARFGAFNPAFVQLCDYEYWLRVGLNTGLVIVPEVLAGFRVHGNSTTQSNSTTGKQFRASELEDLLLLHEIVSNPLFNPVLQNAKHYSPRRNLRYELACKALWCKNYAERRATEGDPQPLKYWNDIALSRPALKDSSWHRVVRSEQWLNKHLLWRFTKDSRGEE